MKSYLLFVSIALLLCTEAKSQSHVNNRLGIGLNYLTLDLPDDITYLPKISYQRQLGKRLFASIEAGNLHHNGFENSFNLIPEVRRRFTLDMSGKVALIRYKGSYLKMEGGPSVWYRNDQLVKSMQYIAEPPTYTPQIVSHESTHQKGWNLGYHVGVEADFPVARRLSVACNARLIQFRRAGGSSLLGAAMYYTL